MSRVRILAAGLIAAAAAHAAAQDPSAPRPFTTEVNYVRVDMYPISGDTPIVDLRQDEVELLEDGMPQKIVQFEHVFVAGATPADDKA